MWLFEVTSKPRKSLEMNALRRAWGPLAPPAILILASTRSHFIPHLIAHFYRFGQKAGVSKQVGD